MLLCIYLSKYLWIYLRYFNYIYIHIHIHVHIHIHIHSHTYTYTYTHTHTHTYGSILGTSNTYKRTLTHVHTHTHREQAARDCAAVGAHVQVRSHTGREGKKKWVPESPQRTRVGCGFPGTHAPRAAWVRSSQSSEPTHFWSFIVGAGWLLLPVPLPTPRAPSSTPRALVLLPAPRILLPETLDLLPVPAFYRKYATKICVSLSWTTISSR